MNSGVEQTRRRLAELHIRKARELAFRIFAYASTIIPKEWGNTYTEQVLMDVYEFAVHARRLNDLCDLKTQLFENITAQRYVISYDADATGYVAKYQDALNTLLHVSELSLGYTVWAGSRVFVQSENVIISYVTAKTDKFSARKVSLFGLAFVFLGEVIPLVQQRYPTYQF